MPPAVTEVGILGLAVYVPRTAVAHADLERSDGAPRGKYTVGLGQNHMAFVSDREDVVSLALTAVDELMTRYKVDYGDIGRLEVGTETVLDKSKSIKTALMQLFVASGNYEVEGLDNTNACYGGTAALFNTLAWAESSAWDGRLGIVVAADIAVYEAGPARPTGGAGAVAMLIGRGENVPIRLEVGLRATHMEHTYDFFKPRLAVEYPTVNGQATIDCFVRAIDSCYALFAKRAEAADGERFIIDTAADYCIFHAPFNKMVQKALARLVYNDFMRTKPGSDPRYASVEQYRSLPRETSHQNRDAQRAFVALAKPLYNAKCEPGAWLAREIGNAYTASLYSSLAALIGERRNELVGARIVMFSFGSGFASSMYSLRVTRPLDSIFSRLRIRERLEQRVVIAPDVYKETLLQRERDYCRFGYEPIGDVTALFPGTFYLTRVGEQGERFYEKRPER